MTDEDDGEEEIVLQDRNGAPKKIGPNILNQVKIVSFLIGLFYRLFVACNYCCKLFMY